MQAARPNVTSKQLLTDAFPTTAHARTLRSAPAKQTSTSFLTSPHRLYNTTVPLLHRESNTATMSKTVHITSPSHFSQVLSSSRIVVTDFYAGRSQSLYLQRKKCSNILRLVWTMQGDRTCLRATLLPAFPTEPDHLHKSRHRCAKGDRTIL